MKIRKFEDKQSWLDGRLGKITGTRAKDIIVKRGNVKKIGFYELIAERLAIAPDGEDPMERGSRLEEEAIKRFESKTKKKVNTDLVIWERDDNPSIAISPDGYIGKTEAVEIKCLGSARHLQAVLEEKVPNEYMDQALQYFVVNDSLKTLHFIFYDPRITAKDYYVIKIERKEVKENIAKNLEYQQNTLAEVDEIVNKLSRF